jgi:hypothetical protein
MIRVSLFSLVGVLVILGIGIKIGWLGHSYLHWFEARAPDVPSHHPVAAAEDAAAKAEHATTHAATAVVGKIDSTLVQLAMSAENRKRPPGLIPLRMAFVRSALEQGTSLTAFFIYTGLPRRSHDLLLQHMLDPYLIDTGFLYEGA